MSSTHRFTGIWRGRMLPWFPAWRVEFGIPVSDPGRVVSTLNEWRPDKRWLMLSDEVACSEAHLWTVWYSTRKREVEGTMVARDVTAEFLRILSGTRQIGLAIDRAGLREGDSRAWVMHLPEIDIGGSLEGLSIPRSTYNDSDEEATRIQEHLGVKLVASRPIPTNSGLIRIGAISEGVNVGIGDIESRFILHAAMADY
jgi:hypothetical protein